MMEYTEKLEDTLELGVKRSKRTEWIYTYLFREGFSI